MTSTAQGTNGQVAFDGATLTVTRKGFVARWTGRARDKQIALSALSGVDFKPASVLTNGFVRFGLQGGTRIGFRLRVERLARAISPEEFEDTVMFTRKQQPAFERLRADIEWSLAAR